MILIIFSSRSTTIRLSRLSIQTKGIIFQKVTFQEGNCCLNFVQVSSEVDPQDTAEKIIMDLTRPEMEAKAEQHLK